MVYRIILLHTDNSGVGHKLKVCVVGGGGGKGTRLIKILTSQKKGVLNMVIYNFAKTIAPPPVLMPMGNVFVAPSVTLLH